jgi:hypothetical protein
MYGIGGTNADSGCDIVGVFELEGLRTRGDGGGHGRRKYRGFVGVCVMTFFKKKVCPPKFIVPVSTLDFAGTLSSSLTTDDLNSSPQKY